MSDATGWPLSPQQRSAWLATRGTPPVLQAPVEVTGAPAPGSLGTACTAVAGRLEILRTTFRSPAGLQVPLQVVEDRPARTGATVDLAALPPAARERAAADAARRLRRAVLASSGKTTGLWAVHLLLAPERHRLLLTLNTLVADRLAVQRLVAEIAGALSGDGAGEPVQYADVAAWLNEIAEDPEAAAGMEHWRSLDADQLLREPAGTETGAGVGTDDGTAVPPFRAEVLERTLSPSLTGAVKDLAERWGVDPEVPVLAAWRLLHRRLAAAPVVVSVVEPGRDYDELVALVGPLARPLPLTGPVGGSFRHLVEATAEELALHRQWQHCLSWDGLVPDAAPEDRFPRVLFEPLPGTQEHRGGGLSLVPDRTAVAAGHPWRFRWNLAVHLGRVGEGALLSLRWDGDRIARSEGLRLAARLVSLLEAAVGAPEIPLPDLPLLLPAERHLLRVEVPAAATPVPPGPATLPALFAAAAERSPERVALVDGQHHLTFGGLARRAEILAARLAARGAGFGSRVAILLPRTTDQVVALLAVTRCGAAWVPMDPSHPPARWATLLDESRSDLVLTRADLAERLPPGGPPVLPLGGGSRLAPEPSLPSLPSVPEALAYVLYTSGSTGRPKGVAVSHGAIVNRVRWMLTELAPAAEDRVLYKTPYTFDASIWEVFATLGAGATLVVARPDGHRDPAYLVDLAIRQGVTVLQVVPSLLRGLVALADLGKAPLGWLFSGGEALPAELVASFRESRPATRVVNLYGPTEAAIDACWWAVPADLAEAPPVLPIGRPVAHLAVRILDPGGRPVPPGAVGELYLVGRGLARGYFDSPGRTAEVFVPDPDPHHAGDRAYRTGDLARWRRDGVVEFLGRRDHQVKVRGVRVELGEVEAWIERYDEVRQAVVAVEPDGAGGERLVGFLDCPRPEAEVADGVRAFLAEHLPDYLVPSRLVVLPELPRTSSGKVDRRRVAEWAAEHAVTDRVQEPLRTATEEVVAAVWCEALEVPSVGRDADFFSLGGHSLLATRVVLRLRELTGAELSLRELFRAPTVERLAAVLDAALHRHHGAATPPLEPAPPDRRRVLSSAQERLFFLHQLRPESTAYNLNTPIRLEGPLSPRVLGQTLDEVRRRHQTLRTTFHEEGDVLTQRVEPWQPQGVPLVDLRHLEAGDREGEARRLLAMDARRPFDLGRGPLLRCLLVRLQPERHVLLYTVHHISADAWSTRVLIGEVGQLYRAFSEGRPSPLPELPVQYADFAAWEAGWLAGGAALEAHLDFWRRQVADVPPLELPLDHPRPREMSFRGAVESLQIREETSDAVRALARRRGVTLYAVLLAAYQVLLGWLAGQERFLVGTSVARRERPEVEGLIGFFVEMVALRAELGGAPTFAGLVERVQSGAVEAFSHQDLPFARLVHELGLRRTQDRNPLFQVVFTFEATRPVGLDVPGLEVESVRPPTATTVFDLALLMQDAPGPLTASMRFATDLFRPATVARVLRRFRTVLEAVAANPEIGLDALGEALEGARRREAAERETRLQEARRSGLRSVRRRVVTEDDNPSTSQEAK